MFTQIFPIVTTTDLPRALRFYGDGLGARITYRFPEADGTTPAYVGLEIGDSHLGIAFDPGAGDGEPKSITLWVYADDCDAAVDRLSAMGVRVVEPPSDQPWGERIARVLDPDGNQVVVGQRAPGAEDPQLSLSARLVSPEPARYTRPEFERRFLVAPGSAWRDGIESYSKVFDDLYIHHTHLRLRTLSDAATGQEFIKLTKKLASGSPYVQMTGSIPLSPMEYEFIAALPGQRIRKKRHYHFFHGNVFAIDVFEGELAGLVLCEVEMASLEELMAVEVPGYAYREVTEDPFFAGGNLARTTRGELARKLGEMGVG